MLRYSRLGIYTLNTTTSLEEEGRRDKWTKVHVHLNDVKKIRQGVIKGYKS